MGAKQNKGGALLCTRLAHTMYIEYLGRFYQ